MGHIISFLRHEISNIINFKYNTINDLLITHLIFTNSNLLRLQFLFPFLVL